jgi:4-hydroxybenzoate polyprenyltransferase
MDTDMKNSIQGLSSTLSGLGLGFFGMWLVIQGDFLWFSAVLLGVFSVAIVYTNIIYKFVNDEWFMSPDRTGLARFIGTFAVRLMIISIFILLFALVSTILLQERIQIPYSVAIISLGVYFVSDIVRVYLDTVTSSVKNQNN